MIRKFIAGLCISFAACAQLHAQDAVMHTEEDMPAFTGHELVLGHGLLPGQQMFAGFNRRVDYFNDRYTGALSFTYRYHASEVISIGVSVAYEHEEGTWNPGAAPLFSTHFGGYGPSGGPGYFRRNCLTIAPEITFNYGESANGMVRLYGVFGIGYTWRNQTATWYSNSLYSSYMAQLPYSRPMHVNLYGSPLGIRIGRAFGGFAEIGLGYKGLFSYGVTYRF